MLVEGEVMDAKEVRKHMASIKKDGSWADVNYKGRDRSDWEPFYHIFRLGDIAKAYAKPGHPLHGDKALLKTIHLAIDHWLASGYKCANGWYNTTATPGHFSKIAVYINDDLTGDRRKAVIAIAGAQERGRKRWSTGANLMHKAQTIIAKAALTGDTALLTEASKRVAGEVKISAGEGIKDDWSFHQHGACAQLGYGTVYLHGVSQMGYLLQGTPYEIPKEKVAIVSQYILNGVQWMVRGPYIAPSVTDRQISRRGDLGPSGGVRGQQKPGGYIGIAEKWIAVDPDNAAALKEFVARQNGKAAPLVGFTHFYRSDISAYHRPGFSFFTHTRSPRVRGTESINSENRKGTPYLHTGDHYILMGTSEYTDMPPVWDWTRLPGLTMYEGIGKIEPQAFAGGVGNGASGMTAMDYKRTLGVRKLWAYHGDIVVCLLGGWQKASGKKGLRTTLDQCALQGAVQAKVGGKTTSLKPGIHELQDLRWVLHNQVGYVPLSPSAVSLKLGEVEGSWHSISSGQSKATVKENVFLCDLLHGKSPKAGGFILAPGSTTKTLDKLTSKPPCVVIRNDRDVQCIRFADGTSLAAFYTPGKIELDRKLILSVDKSCLALWSGKELRLCDPTNPKKEVPVKVMWRGKTHQAALPAGGKVLQLPQAAPS
jgi:chondroitin AC lyase